MPEGSRWGRNRYYADEAQAIKSKDGFFNNKLDERWAHKLTKYISDPKEQVTRTVHNWNTRIRDVLRSETGVKLLTTNIPIRIMDGIPAPLQDIFEESLESADLLLRQSSIAAAAEGTKFIFENYPAVTNYLKCKGELPPNSPSPEDMQSVSTFLEALKISVEKNDLSNKLFAVAQDSFGAYFFTRPEIHIYWLPISILSKTSGLELEALTLIVLAHELAHAYSHRGKDTDDAEWFTEAFANSDDHIVEGIAQFYTQRVCQGLASRYPMPALTFENMLQRQATPYTCFQDWIKPPSKTNNVSRGGEIIRACLIQARRERITKREDFENLVTEYRSKLTLGG